MADSAPWDEITRDDGDAWGSAPAGAAELMPSATDTTPPSSRAQSLALADGAGTEALAWSSGWDAAAAAAPPPPPTDALAAIDQAVMAPKASAPIDDAPWSDVAPGPVPGPSSDMVLAAEQAAAAAEASMAHDDTKRVFVASRTWTDGEQEGAELEGMAGTKAAAAVAADDTDTDDTPPRASLGDDTHASSWQDDTRESMPTNKDEHSDALSEAAAPDAAPPAPAASPAPARADSPAEGEAAAPDAAAVRTEATTPTDDDAAPADGPTAPPVPAPTDVAAPGAAPRAPAPPVPALLPAPSALAEALGREQLAAFLTVWLTDAEAQLAAGVTDGSAMFVEILLCLCGARRVPVQQSGAPPAIWSTMEPGRVVRKLMARCLAALYAVPAAPKPPLLDVLATLQESLAAVDVKSEHLEQPMAALCVAESLLARPDAGHGVSWMPVVVALAKAAHAPVRLRVGATRVLTVIMPRAVPASTPAMVKDTHKTLRQALHELSAPLVRASARALAALAPVYETMRTRSDIEAALTHCAKLMHSADSATRAALAQLAASLLLLPDAVPTDAQWSLLRAHVARATSAQARSALLLVYDELVARVPAATLEGHVAALHTHLVDEIATRVAALYSAGDAQLLQHGVRRVLARVAARLAEPAQARWLSWLATHQLAQWPPATPAARPPSDMALILSLQVAAQLVQQLAQMPPAWRDEIGEPIVRLLSHPHPGVQAHAAHGLRVASSVQPTWLAPLLRQLHELLLRDADALQKKHADHGVAARARVHGHSVGLAALVPLAAAHPLAWDADTLHQLWTLANDLLESSAQLTVPDASAAVHAGWTLLAALMTLGPTYTHAHLPRLVALWRGALLERAWPDAHDEGAWLFLASVRAGALGALDAFLRHGGLPLWTAETRRRIVALASHTLAFLHAADHADHTRAQDAASTRAALANARVRTRLFHSMTHLAADPALGQIAEPLAAMATETLLRPERCAPSAAQAAVHASTGHGLLVWTAHDGTAFGVTSTFTRLPPDYEPCEMPTALSTAPLAAGLAHDLHTPVLGALEYDPLVLLAAPAPDAAPAALGAPADAPRPAPPLTAEVDAGVALCAALWIDAPRDVQIRLAERWSARARALSSDKQPGRATALLANALAVWRDALRAAAARPARRPTGLANERINGAVRAVLQTALVHDDRTLRAAAIDAYADLARVAGSASLAQQVAFLVEHIMDPRRADARAACAAALGRLYARVGGLHAAPLTKTVSTLLLSLAQDPHPAVHTAALEALAATMEAASAAYAPYVPATLHLCAQLASSASHESHGGSAGSTNLRRTYAAYAALARALAALAGVRGPDWLEAPHEQRLLHALLWGLTHEDRWAAAESWHGLQRLCLVVPALLDTPVATLRFDAVASEDEPVAHAALAALLRQLAQGHAAWKAPWLGARLWHHLLRDVETLAPVHEFLSAWVRATATLRPLAWLDLLSSLLRGAPAAQEVHAADVDGEDDAALWAAQPAADADAAAAAAAATPSWRLQRFLLEAVHAVVTASPPPRDALVRRAGELVKIACSACVAPPLALRDTGLALVHDLIIALAAEPDPAAPDARLLQLYAAPLAAALTPALAADSAPHTLAAALRVAAQYVEHVDAAPTNRVARLLRQALETAARPDMAALGELKLTPLGASCVRLDVLSAWAHVAMAPACGALVQLDLPTLAPLWSRALTTYAALRADPASALGTPDALLPPAPDAALAPLLSRTSLAYFAPTWPALLRAMTWVWTSSPQATNDASLSHLVLYSLALETLAHEIEQQGDARLASLVARSLTVLVGDQFVGPLLLQDALFDEWARVCQRALASDHLALHDDVLDTMQALVRALREQLLEDTDGVIHDEHMPTTKLGHLWRVVAQYAEQLPLRRGAPAARAACARKAWNVLLAMMQVCGTALHADLMALLLHTIVQWAAREDDAALLLTHALPIVKEIGAHMARVAAAAPADAHRCSQGFWSALIDMADALRARQGDMVVRRSGNALVAASLWLTSVDGAVPLSLEGIERLGFLLRHKLDTDHDAELALQCVKMLVTAGGAPTRRATRLAIGGVLASVVAYAVRHAHEPSRAAPAVHILLALPTVMPPADALLIALPVVVPTTTAADDPRTCGATQQILTELVGLARSYAADFRGATAAMAPGDRAQLHDTLRAAMGGSAAAATRTRTEATISLKTFGSS